MVISHNLEAMSTARNLNIASGKKSKISERLSSGYRINRSGDDAAGLSISEKMRGQIRGLEQASTNAQDGISLIQTAEGALQEVQEVVHRIRELAVQSANDTNTKNDREAIQLEIDGLVEELDRIAMDTEFNTLKLLDGSLEGSNGIFGADIQTQSNLSLSDIESVLDEEGLSDLVSVEYDFTTSQVPKGGDTTVGYEKLAENLEKQIVPQIVNSILSKYSAFSYLNGSTIGIGLRLYNQSSNTLAYVSAGYREQTGDGGVVGTKEYQLGINLNHLDFNADGTLKAYSREELEATIAHEMIHGFMAEATTNGMLGNDRFPLWFVEGMAQTASGPGGWTSSLSAASSDADISKFLSKIGAGYNSGNGAANYGTGYLATMYLGYMAGTGATMEDRITDGLNKIMSTVMGGTSLDDAIAQHTKYNGLSDFSNKVKNDKDAFDFTRDLITATGSGRGGLVTGDLTATDFAPDADLNGVDVFKLYADKEKVTNIYTGSDYVILSGGGSRSPQPPPGTSSSGGAKISGEGGLNLQVGAQTGQAVQISIGGVKASDLGMQFISVTTHESSEWAIESCDSALNRISGIRADLGAYQNGLEHTIANLDNTAENTQAAESRIRDVDIAKAMVEYSCNNIIMQVGQSFLAQANQSKQGILTIL